MAEILHQLSLVVSRLFIGFYTSQVVQDFFSINSSFTSIEAYDEQTSDCDPYPLSKRERKRTKNK